MSRVLIGRSASAGLRLTLFGAPTCRIGSRAYPFRRERPYQLLAFLAARGDWVTRDQLAELLYPGRDNASARNNLRKVLLGARRSDWAADVEGRGELVRWPVATDVQAFERSLDEQRLAEGVGTYGGAFGLGLDDEHCAPFTDWLVFERNRLASRWRGAAISLLPKLEPGPALELADRLLNDDPYDDEALRAKLVALTALGRAGEARHAYRTFAKLIGDELGVDVSAATRDAGAALEEPARRRAGPSVPAARLEDGDFVGREREIADTLTLLCEPDTRLVTVTGVGGVGKTRLARHVFRQATATGRFSGGEQWIDLYDLSTADRVVHRLADGLGLTLQHGDAWEQLLDLLHDRALLLVLDNAEHLVDGATPTADITALLARVLARCPGVVTLVTSRVRLNLGSERVVSLDGLPWPTDDRGAHEVLNAPAVQLFVARARRSLATFDATSEIDAISEICRIAEGLPLALELAAAWTYMLPCTEILADLRAGLEVAEPLSAAEGRGLRAAFERSWQLAAPSEREALARLSVLCGSFTRDAAHAIAGASLSILGGLVDKSLLRSELTEGHASGRFSLHPLLRVFARRKLAERPDELDIARVQHAAYFGQHVAQYRDFERTIRPGALAEIQRELEDVSVAWQFACEAHDCGFVASTVPVLQRFFELKGRRDEGIGWLELAEQALQPSGRNALAARCEIGAARSILLEANGEYRQAEAVARQTLQMARLINHRATTMTCVNMIGLTCWHQGQLDEARPYFNAALKLAQKAGDSRLIAEFSMNLGILDEAQGNSARAAELYRSALALYRARGSAKGAVYCLNNLGNLYSETGLFDESVSAFREALGLCQKHGLESVRGALLLNLGYAFLDHKDLAAARQTLLQAVEVQERVGMPQFEWSVQQALARLAIEDHDYASARGSLARAMRAALDRDQFSSQLSVVAAYGALLATEGNTRRAAALWLFAIDHARTEEPVRRNAASKLAALSLDEAARREAQCAAHELTLTGIANEITAADSRA